MSLLRTLRLAIDVATRRRDAASQAMAQAQARQIAAQQQMEQLKSYANDTEQRWASQAQICALPELMRHHYQFMERLGQAILMQEGVVAEQARWVALARKALLEADLRVETLRRLLRNKEAEAAQVQQRREQRQMDEMAATRFGRTAGRGFSGGTG